MTLTTTHPPATTPSLKDETRTNLALDDDDVDDDDDDDDEHHDDDNDDDDADGAYRQK